MPCPFCGAQPTSGIALSDGNIVHDSCYKNAVSQLANLSSQISDMARTIGMLESKLRAAKGVIGSIARVLFGGDNSDSIERELNRAKASLTRARTQHLKINNSILYIYDFWTGYPPDWKERTKRLKEISHGSCTQCGSYNNLHAHHITSLSRGGSNRLENLILLCESCHKRKHNTDSFSDSTSSPAMGDRIKNITYAISSRRNIEFLYKKRSDIQYDKRVLTPYKLKTLAHKNTDGATLCVEGFCHKRQENRTFALKRMKNLKVI